MNQIGVGEFVRRLKESMESGESRFSFFLGAGCSVTSGIPAAGTLVKNWLRKLKKHQTGTEEDIDGWAKGIFPEYNGDNAALFYGKVIERLFLTAQERQQEIERLVAGKEPGFGYAVLAQLMSDDQRAKHCNIVLTTNFDDLVADALYLYSNRKPLVILHESLVDFVKISPTRPFVVKLHGDARLQPRNTELETEQFDDAVKKMLKNLLSETGLIFIGYGGNDMSLVSILKELPQNAPPWGVYWVGERIPDNEMGEWLQDRDGAWVKQRDFDELMLLVWNEFDLKHPESARFDKLLDQYFETFKKLKSKVEAKPESEEKRVLEKAAEKAASKFKSWWPILLEADKYEKVDAEKADKVYREGISQFPGRAELLGSYALFLKNVRKDYGKAEEYYLKSIEAGPNDAEILNNYAVFLTDVRKDHDTAEELFKKAIDADPSNATSLGNYAIFLKNIRKDHDRAEEFYKKAIEVDPNHANILGNYASFLTGVRKDHDRAEQFYKKAIDADPNDAPQLGNYAIFLKDVRKDHDRAEQFYKKAIDADPNNAPHLGNYANFLKDVRKDHDRAEQFYKKAIDADPSDAPHLGNYAGFLVAQGREEEGRGFLAKAIALAEDNTTLLLECHFYEYAHSAEEGVRRSALVKMKKLIQSGVRSPYWNLEDNVKRAAEDGHPHPEFLKALARVICDELDAKELDKFDQWKES